MNKVEVNKSKTYLITGAAGFIGYHLSHTLLKNGCTVIGLDNINDYYDTDLKYSRLKILEEFDRFTFKKGDISNKEFVEGVFNTYKPKVVINLAAQAGVRYSIDNPDVYITSNIVGFHNILEACRYNNVDHLIYASSSSVYGANKKVPFEETDFVDHPVSLYAATKKSNELMAYTYSHLYGIPTTGLRFFTVYGSFGRPDMAYYKFVSKFFKNEPIKIYNNGNLEKDLYRDFTYIDDIIQGIVGLIEVPPKGHSLFNIGNNNPEKLMTFITTLENCLSNSLDRKVAFDKIFEDIKPGDVPATYASTDKLNQTINFKPETSLESGLQVFTDWYVSYHKLS